MADIEDAGKACGDAKAKPRVMVKIPKVDYDTAMGFKAKYEAHIAERAKQDIPPLPLSAADVAAVIALLQKPPAGDEAFLLDLISNRVPPGVDDASYAKADFLGMVVKGQATSPVVSPVKAIELLGMMQGGYNVAPLVEALDASGEVATAAATALKASF